MKMLKILVGCPTSEHKAYCLKDYADAVKRLDYPNFDILLVDNSEHDAYMKAIHDAELSVIKGPYSKHVMQRIVDSRNLLVKMAIDGNYDCLFSLEQDVIPPRDALKQLLAAGKDVVTGVYCKPWTMAVGEQATIMPLVWDYLTEQDYTALLKHVQLKEKNPELYALLHTAKDYAEARQRVRKPITLAQVQKPELRQVKSAGVGCMLISRDVLKKIKFRTNSNGFDDMTFCEDLEKAGIPLFLSTAVKCDHLVKMGQWESIMKEQK
ncbi:MAG: hypothetical protein V1725_00765 [archaeon]